MGAHPDAVAKFNDYIRCALTPEERDKRLEELFDIVARATEWDAYMWGFGDWMKLERREMDRRARCDGYSPREPLMRVRTDAQMVAETGETRRAIPRQANPTH